MRDKNSIAVDASCIGNPGMMEYQGIDLKTKKRIIYGGPFPMGTNNIGEFLAIINAIKYLREQNDNTEKNLKKTIYSDSMTALARIKSKKIKTTLPYTNKTKELLFKLQEAITRLKTHDITPFPIKKRETNLRGENPADFGRK